MANFYLDICLSDIPRERIKTAANGKKYLKAIIRPRKETDRDGYDHYIAAFIPKDERGPEDKPAFIGRAQEKRYEESAYQQKKAELAQQANDDPNADLPFDHRPGHRR